MLAAEVRELLKACHTEALAECIYGFKSGRLWFLLLCSAFHRYTPSSLGRYDMEGLGSATRKVITFMTQA